MAEFALPKNSRITGGKTWPKPAGATETREFRVYRWNPDDGKNPSVETPPAPTEVNLLGIESTVDGEYTDLAAAIKGLRTVYDAVLSRDAP